MQDRKTEKDDTKTRHPQMIFYGKRHCGYSGNLTLLDILVLGVALKFRSKELELEADIW